MADGPRQWQPRGPSARVDIGRARVGCPHMSERPRCPRRLPITLAAVIVTSLFTLAPASARPVLAADPEAAPLSPASPATTLVGTSAITPGSVNRTSVNLTASYAVTLGLRYGSRAFSVDSTATITNTSGGPIDRVELNTIAARPGGMTLRYVGVDGVAVTRRIDDQTIIVRLGGILAAGATVKIRVKYQATLRSTLGGSNWLFT